MYETAPEQIKRAQAARLEGRFADARDELSAAVKDLRGDGASPALAYALTRLAQIERDLGDLAEAERVQSEALELYRMFDQPLALAHVARHLADIRQDAGRPAEAAPGYEEALALYRAAPDADPLDVANAVRSYAVNRESLGERAAARGLWGEARERYAALDDLFERLIGRRENPGVAEADERLAALAAG